VVIVGYKDLNCIYKGLETTQWNFVEKLSEEVVLANTTVNLNL
jgi:hypothetical protein